MWPAPLRVHIDPAACTDFSKITGEFEGSLGAMWASPPTNVPEGFPNRKILPSLYWDESTKDTSWCHPNSKSAALPPFRADGAGPGDFEKTLLYARSADVLRAAGRRNLSAFDFLSVRRICVTASASLRL